MPALLDVVLRDGSTITLREFAPSDADAVVDLLRRLSPDSRALRFHGGGGAAPYVASLCRPGAAETLLAERNGRVAAIASAHLDPATPDQAEVALAVEDAMQGLGLGTRMLEILAQLGRARGLARFDAYLSPANVAMRELLRESGFRYEERTRHGETALVLELATGERLEALSATRARSAATASMRSFFRPASVALVGASRDPRAVGGMLAAHLLGCGFPGPVYLVNASGGEAAGRPVYLGLRDVPGHVELAVVAVPAERVERVVDDCLALGVRAILVISAGFAETGPRGRALEAVLRDKVRAAGARLIGPNCLGLLTTDPTAPLNATFAVPHPPIGAIALATQSGGIGLAVIEEARRLGLGLSSFVSTGNKADVSGNDLLQYWVGDPRTQVILLYLESFGNPRRFIRIARDVARSKPIVVLKAGRTGAGARAASSHTAALAASDAVVDGLFRQSGIIRARTLQEMFDVAALLTRQPLPRGRRVAVLTNAGGPGILAADACEAAGLSLPPLSGETVAALRAFAPAAASLANPVDLLAAATPGEMGRALSLLLDDPEVDAVIVIHVPPLVTSSAEIAAAVAQAAEGSAKPVVPVWMTGERPPASLAALPAFAFPEPVAVALAHAAEYHAWRARPPAAAASVEVDLAAARAVVDAALDAGEEWLSAEACAELARAAGIDMAPSRVVASATEAVEAARALGFPVAVKALGLVHKSDAGGVRLDRATDADVLGAWCDMHARLGITAALVQPMVRGGLEILVGAVQDPMFGPLLACGSGGVGAEHQGDTSFRLHPLGHDDAAEMVAALRNAPLLRGARGRAAGGDRAVEDVLLRVAALAGALPELLEIEINPLSVTGDCALAIDLRARVGPAPIEPTTRRIAY